MEQEVFYTGYCRAMDASRMVAVLLNNGVLEECDCGYPSCPHTPNCSIAQEIFSQVTTE